MSNYEKKASQMIHKHKIENEIDLYYTQQIEGKIQRKTKFVIWRGFNNNLKRVENFP